MHCMLEEPFWYYSKIDLDVQITMESKDMSQNKSLPLLKLMFFFTKTKNVSNIAIFFGRMINVDITIILSLKTDIFGAVDCHVF